MSKAANTASTPPRQSIFSAVRDNLEDTTELKNGHNRLEKKIKKLQSQVAAIAKASKSDDKLEKLDKFLSAAESFTAPNQQQQLSPAQKRPKSRRGAKRGHPDTEEPLVVDTDSAEDSEDVGVAASATPHRKIKKED